MEADVIQKGWRAGTLLAEKKPPKLAGPVGLAGKLGALGGALVVAALALRRAHTIRSRERRRFNSHAPTMEHTTQALTPQSHHHGPHIPSPSTGQRTPWGVMARARRHG